MNKKIPLKERLESLKLAIRWTYQSSKPLTFLIFVVTIFGGLLTIVEPYIFKVIIDGVVSKHEFSILGKINLGLAGILIFYGFSKIIQSILWDVQSIIKRIHCQKLDTHATYVLMDKISSLDAVYFENPDYYNTLSKANQNFWRINEFFWGFTFFVSEIISVLVIVGALLTFNWMIVGLIALASLPSIIFTFKVSQINWNAFDTASPIGRHANYYKTLMTERPEAVKELKLFNLKSNFLQRYKSLFADYFAKQTKAAKKEAGLFLMVGILEGTFAVLAAWFVIDSFFKGLISVGELTFYWALLFQFSEHARYMVRMIGDLNQNATFLTPIAELIKFQPTIKEEAHPKKFPSTLKKGIEFKNVTFNYPRAKTASLKHFNLLIRPGESIAIVGKMAQEKQL